MRRTTVLVVLTALLLAAGLWSGASAQQAGRSNTLRFVLSQNLVTLDPANLGFAADRVVAQNVFSGLVTFKPGTAEVIPDLATRYEVSPDGKTYTFYLRKGVKFHKGYGELTSRDVKFTIERYKDRTQSRLVADYAPVERVETPDPYTAVFRLRTPFAPLLSTLGWQSGFIMSEKAVRELGRAITTNPVGTGPYVFESYAPGNEVVLGANRDYYGGGPRIEKVVLKIIPEEMVGILALQRGEVDMMPLRTVGAWKLLKSSPRFQVIEVPGIWMDYVMFNVTRPPLSDVRVRRALAHAVDWKAMEEFYSGLAELNPSFQPKTVFGWTKDVPTYPTDLNKARALLAEAGHAGGLALEIQSRKELMFDQLAVLVKDWWAKAGVQGTILITDAAGELAKINPPARNYQVHVQGLSRLDPDHYYAPFLRSDSTTNYMGYAGADDLIDAQRTAPDAKTRRQVLLQLQRKIAEDLPVISLGTRKSLVVARQGVAGITAISYAGVVIFRTAHFAGN
ncbi:MAG: ABC transporter substrate-binding protein [Armatimonadetes bacterium]|nr:ABC transporter substrate-binding protein [Armatimonadota bacterium]